MVVSEDCHGGLTRRSCSGGELRRMREESCRSQGTYLERIWKAVAESVEDEEGGGLARVCDIMCINNFIHIFKWARVGNWTSTNLG